MGVVPRLENGWVLGPWGFDSLSFRLWRHGRAGKAARCYRAGGHSRSQVRVLLPPSAPRSSAEQSGGLRTHVRPFDSGRGVHFTATSFNGRTAGCYPANAGSTPAVAASQRSCPDRLAVEDAGLSHRKRGFDSRSGYCVTARPRTRLETRPGCLPGEAGSTPVEGVSLSP